MSNYNPDDQNQAEQLPWVDLLDVFKSEKYFDKVAAIPKTTLEFAADPDNRDYLIESASKSLKLSTPEEATEEKAILLADLMSVMARLFLQEKAKAKK